MINKFTTKLTNEKDVTLDHENIRSVDYDIEEIDVSIYWFVELTTKRDDYCEVNAGILKVVVDARIYEIDNQKWRYVDETLTAGDLINWHIDTDEWEQDFPICMSINDITIDFTNKMLTIG